MKILILIGCLIILIIIGSGVRVYAMYMEKKQMEKDQKEMVRKYKEKMLRGNRNKWGEYV